MICYQDCTFCPYHAECNKGEDCAIAYTDEVKLEAQAWWGSDDAPVCLFAERPECFEEVK